ncbi:FAD-dependent monooxygenase [Chamaesiphon sp. VAR_48_metabat_403]|uniref:FAD-dependent monooxygenase n=1 Tax=Chamaesiphon sp. VAR_48_metabat_403 TaxID=2964700 RepID=UPI00286E14EA|nr:FAD-dependent monooxygenase [Chamaesiphon sp. VAR_48_metabat_403]
MTHIVIIGAGPTGLTLAMLLAQRGIAVTAIEASTNFRRIFRGEALMPSGLAAIDAMGLTDLVAQIPHRALDAWEFYIENRSIFRVEEPMTRGGKPCTLISQPAFLAGVLDRAQQCAKFELIQGTNVRDLVWNGDRVAGVTLSDGREIAADLVIGADGRNSIVREQANLTLDRATQNFDILWFKLPSSPEFAAENVFYSIVRGGDAFGVFQGAEGNLQVGWSLHQDDRIDWQQVDWAEKLAATAPDWLAAHLRSQQAAIERPLLLSIVVGRCVQWQQPGVLVLGDAAHPMSPIRAQGINMALRDAVVAANHLVPVCQGNLDLAAIDRVLPQIQAEREPEIIRIQKLQQQEVNQAELLRNYPLIRHAVSRLAPIIGSRIRHSWLDRQLQLRDGSMPVQLRV